MRLPPNPMNMLRETAAFLGTTNAMPSPFSSKAVTRLGLLREILAGAPGLSRTLLTQRLNQLERLGIVESAPKAHGRGHRYQLTSSGHDLFKVCQALGEWGARWLEIAPENLDPFVALWSMCNALRRDRLPNRRIVIR